MDKSAGTIGTQVSEELDLLRDTVRRFAEAEIAPRARQMDEDERVPGGPVGEDGRLRASSASRCRTEYGGSGLSYLAHVITMEEISRASASVGLSYAAHSNLCINNLYLNGNEAQRKKFLPKLCTGEWMGRWPCPSPAPVPTWWAP